MKKLLWLVAVLILVGIGYFIFQQNKSSSIGSDNVYKNVKFGFQFNTPKDWKVINQEYGDESYSYISSPDLVLSEGENTGLIKGSQIIVHSLKLPATFVLKSIDDLKEVGRTRDIKVDNENALIHDGGVYINSKGQVLDIVRNGVWIRVTSIAEKTNQNNSKLLEDVIGSWKFI